LCEDATAKEDSRQPHTRLARRFGQIEIAGIAPHAIRRTAIADRGRKKPIEIPDDAHCARVRFTTSADSIALGKTLKESTFRV
jgi:hypothetical protein